MQPSSSGERRHWRPALRARHEVIMEEYVERLVLSADAKALATYSEGNLNVVPVSSVRIDNGKIVLVDYFMEKTAQNIQKSSLVALVCWKGMHGFQIKGSCEYIKSGSQNEHIYLWARQLHPERTVRGILIIDPLEIYDIAPDKKSVLTI